MRILNFGSCNLDYVYSLDHIVAPGETESSYGMEIFPGGKGLNQSIAAAKAGVEVYHAGCVGEDGKLLLDILQESGVNTQYLQSVPGKNGHAMIQVTRDGENSIVLYTGSNGKITEELIDHVLENFVTGDILLLQNEINLVPLIAEKAHKKGMFTVLNPSPYNKNIEKVDLTHISCLILNEVEGKGLSKEDDPQKMLAFFREHYPELKVMLTLGKKGCIYADESAQIPHKAFAVQAVDTTAAGDTFTGYFAAGLANQLPMEKILQMASAASAISVTRNGAAPSVPYMAEVLAFLKDREGQ